MIFNRWRKYPNRKPLVSGKYLCTVQHGEGIDKPCIMELYYRGIWMDHRRQSVFNGYKVYKSCRAAIDDNRVFSDNDCERIDVIAWRKIPKVYGWRKLKKKEKRQEIKYE